VIEEVILFWAVLAGFLVFDNFVLLPEGADYLRFGVAGTFTYEPKARLEARGRDLVILNPLNLFHRIAVTRAIYGLLDISQYRAARRQIRVQLKALNVFSALGTVYLAVVLALAVASFQVSFERAFVGLIGTHVFFWVVNTTLLVMWRERLELNRYQTFAHAAEAIFVPAYCINLGKRLWFKRVLDVPALPLGLRQAGQIQDQAEREFYIYQLESRIKHIESGLALPIEDSPCALNALLSADEPSEAKESRV